MIEGGVLDTGRLVVRPFEEGDVDRLVAIFADPDVARHVGDGAPLDRAEALLWVRNSRGNLSRYGYGTGAVIEKDGGRIIGWAGVARPEREPPEVIYGFERAAWRKGYGRELLAALVAFAAARGIDPVRATVAAGNAASSALLLAAGFSLADPHYGGDPQVQLYEWTAST